MDEYNAESNYLLKLILGLVIGLLVLFLIVPLGANVIANQNVANAANNALDSLNSVDSSLPESTSSVMPSISQPEVISTNQTQYAQTDTNDNDNGENSAVSVDGMRIRSGTITTGSSLSSKTVCEVFVGDDYSGADIQISTLYSRDGDYLNEGRLVAKTVDSEGVITLKSADSYSLYPDYCLVTIYDVDGEVLDSKEVYLETTSGTQSF